MAKLQEEHIEWVKEELLDWDRALNIINLPVRSPPNQGSSPPPLNEGNEAMGHLTYQKRGTSIYAATGILGAKGTTRVIGM
ncbi:hypothetical protein AnigIFM50267_010897 [Aspergillus niger]|nr:hypothetical protein AnigIFM50267_010897 [Aspergillus niger]GLA16032.1 hypothetical protein AnigIFM62618_002590 [Aspergillus niger]